MHQCSKKISIKGGSTKGLFAHVRTIHQINLNATAETPTREVISDVICLEGAGTKKRKLTHYFSNNPPTLDEILARMTAKDGLPFNILITSKDIRAGLTARGLDVPLSGVTIREKVMDYASKLNGK